MDRAAERFLRVRPKGCSYRARNGEIMRNLSLSIVTWMLAGGACLAGDVAPPPGVKHQFDTFADGVQIYVCAVKDGSTTWAFKQPEAALFDAHGRQIGTHGGGPAWTFFDGSSVTGELIAKESAPDKGAIPFLLLRVKAHEGSGALTPIAFIRRIDTKGGLAPAQSCTEGEIARMRYSATYQFFTN
jgi:hypothetical protein